MSILKRNKFFNIAELPQILFFLRKFKFFEKEVHKMKKNSKTFVFYLLDTI